MNIHSNRRSALRNFNTIFKNLAVTKRQIMDLQKSISNVVQSMNKIDNYLATQRNSWSIVQQNQSSDLRMHINNQAGLVGQIDSHSESTDNSLDKTIKIERFSYKPNHLLRCLKCSLQFQNENSLAEHIRMNHRFCRLCQSFYNEEKQTHFRTYCPQERVFCMGCSAKVRRRNLQKHIQDCCYKICFKCKQAIYVKAYGYHIQECKRSKGLIKECKRLPTSGQSGQQSNWRTQRLNRRLIQQEVSLCCSKKT